MNIVLVYREVVVLVGRCLFDGGFGSWFGGGVFRSVQRGADFLGYGFFLGSGLVALSLLADAVDFQGVNHFRYAIH